MAIYKVKENFSIGKDTYDILDENDKLLYKVKGKLINIVGEELKIYDADENEIAVLTSNMRKNSWKLEPIKEGVVNGQYNISGMFTRKLSANFDNQLLVGKIRGASFSLASNTGERHLTMKKHFSLNDVYSVEASDELDVLGSTIAAVIFDQVFREGSRDSKGVGIISSILRKFI